ncbi:RNA-splicing ligase RtcB [Candidatus Poribacteria bacterium]|nr:RNA-splicing ligase RtcB [Candidatus Poribacteria bacterium]
MGRNKANIPLEKVDNYRWRVPSSYMQGMRVEGRVYADNELVKVIKTDQSLQQVANVAHLPGIVKYSLAMPDIHWGYGFPIGGVAATDPENDGVVSPGGVGYDINCGVRMLRTNLEANDIRSKMKDLINAIFAKIPCGVGEEGNISLSPQEERDVLTQGAGWAVKNGYGRPDDLDFTEANGCLKNADPKAVSGRAFSRGKRQLGTLGSGNHFLEVQKVDKIYHQEAAKFMGLEEGQVSVMIHSGSRGFGHQVCDDFLKRWGNVTKKYNIQIPDRQLVCAPVNSSDGQQYLAGMAAAANYAWANRQCLMHWTREVFQDFFGMTARDLGLELIYDIAHNIAKIETHKVDGEDRKLCVHRKGSTRAFPPGHAEVPDKYKSIGQPVIIPGDMGTASYILVGTELAMEETFGSTCHGAGRMLSRRAAIRSTKGRPLARELEDMGIFVRARGRTTLQEEAPEAYKDIDEVVKAAHEAGISRRVARMKPLAVMKG